MKNRWLPFILVIALGNMVLVGVNKVFDWHAGSSTIAEITHFIAVLLLGAAIGEALHYARTRRSERKTERA